MDESLTFEIVSEGIVAPLTFLEQGERGGPGIFDGGVYHADGTVCARSLQRKAGFLNQPRPLVTLAGVSRVHGKHLYAGMLKNEHFGHFVAESLSRLWPLADDVARGLESIVFYARMHRQPIPPWASDFISIIEPDVPLRIVSDETIFESLIVPDAAAHPSNGFVYGHSAIRELFGRLRRIDGKEFEKVYISRSKLSNAGGILGERILEENLMREGFYILHPQEHSLREQLAFYNGARRLVFAEGAALHLFALTCRPEQRVYIIQRRKHAAVFHWQLRTFGASPMIGPEAPSAYYIPKGHGQSTLLARARINFEMLRDQLAAEGLARGTDWNLPDQQMINEEIRCIEKNMGQKLVEHSSDSM